MLEIKIVPLPSLPTVSAAALRNADSRACAEALPRLGVPRTAREWTALAKIASGEHDVPPEQCARLASLGLIARVPGLPRLTMHGRLTLGFSE